MQYFIVEYYFADNDFIFLFLDTIVPPAVHARSHNSLKLSVTSITFTFLTVIHISLLVNDVIVLVNVIIVLVNDVIVLVVDLIHIWLS